MRFGRNYLANQLQVEKLFGRNDRIKIFSIVFGDAINTEITLFSFNILNISHPEWMQFSNWLHSKNRGAQTQLLSLTGRSRHCDVKALNFGVLLLS